ncbi:MAG TPA: hypothetical protein DEO84_04495 [candidate division Zixibacteria bacterium]|jgi:hypothetical protein|nr:hypothetical protein [candidate division Zixibacteria bacterium]
MKTLFVSAAIILLFGMAPCAMAYGVIDVIVYNVDGVTPLPHVHILTYDSLNVVRADEVSDSLGRYALSISPGTYHEHLTKIGFVTGDINHIVVVDNETTHVSFNMQLSSCCCDYIIGDANGSGILTGLDVTFSVRYFKGGPHPPYSCECTPGHTWYISGDVNASCTFDGLDVTYMVRYFKGGSPPAPCPSCPPVPYKTIR